MWLKYPKTNVSLFGQTCVALRNGKSDCEPKVAHVVKGDYGSKLKSGHPPLVDMLYCYGLGYLWPGSGKQDQTNARAIIPHGI